ncbi:MAG TPA: exodeoxyribonuclease V subunit gamma [Arachnia sp.]|nr:exodeoxyribonuclease V subunit gamma [Arachnia sp.]HMT86581.1 exodeoxyribonuclease V subunit gamma [Arachnia sp.]
MLRLTTAPRWSGLVPQVSAWLHETLTDPFCTARIVVADPGTGKLLSQDLARIDGISAGISAVSAARLTADLARLAGVEDEWRAWRGHPLVAAALAQLDEVAASHPLLAAHLQHDRPARSHTVAARASELFRCYADSAPQLVEAWLSGEDCGLDGEELPAHLSWQPPLLRLAAEHLQIDPLELQEEVVGAASSDPVPTGVFAVDELTGLQQRLIEALGGSGTVPVWQVSGSEGEAWARRLADVALPQAGQPRPAPLVEVHNSHGRRRQAEVLRDRLTALFEQDPTLEPRDVVIVCPQPEHYAVALDLVFGASEEPLAHPGRSLRLQPQLTRTRANPVLDLLEALIALPVTRASAPELTELLLGPAVAHRWHLAERGEDVHALVSEAGIRWGLDSAHRADFGLPGLPQGTWLTGLDSLLTGLTMTRGSAPVLPAPAAEGVSSSDLDLVGALSEVLSRLRKFVAETRTPAPLRVWTQRLRTALTEVAGLPPSDEWMLAQAHSALTDLADAGPAAGQLTRAEFARMLSSALTRPGRRSPAGNGSIQVVGVGELQHAEFRVVALLGLEDDSAPADMADSVDLGTLAPDPRRRRLTRLLAHARAAERLLIVRRAWSERSNAPVARPVAIDWLLRRLDAAPATVVDHPATAFSADAFLSGGSTDRLSYLAAEARRDREQQLARSAEVTPSPQARRRHSASALPVAAPESDEEACAVTVAELASFLDNPAKAFLRARLGLTFFAEPELSEALPLSLGGLEGWQIQSALLHAAQEGQDPDAARATARRRPSVPPGRLGAAAVDDALTLVRGLWGQAASDWRATPHDHLVELDLGGVRLADSIQVRGRDVVAITASSGIKTLLGPWLSVLALSASGSPTEAVVHRVGKQWRQSFPESRRLVAPPADQALAQLRVIAEAYRTGRQRLLAVPFEPAVAFVQELGSREGFRLAEWQLPPNDFRSRWRFRHESWDLFFRDQAAELFDDPAGPDDPAPTAELRRAGLPAPVSASRFAAWAVALYGPFLREGAA